MHTEDVVYFREMVDSGRAAELSVPMNAHLEWRLSAPWNVLSARLNPFVVFVVCVVLVVLSCQRQRWLYLIPLVVLGVNACLSFAFWTFRLKRSRGDSWLTVVMSIGSVSRAWGLFGLMTIAAMFAIVVTTPRWFTEHGFVPNTKLWVLWGWAAVELIHSHVHKLTFGARDTLEHILEGRCWTEAGRPLGGAIGQQLRKLRHQHAQRDQSRRGA